MLDIHRIITLITEKGYSCSSVEKSLGFGNGAIRRWETNSPSIKKLFELSNFLNIPINYLLTSEESSKALTQNERELLNLLNEFDERNQAKFIGKIELIADEMHKKLAKENLDKLVPIDSEKDIESSNGEELIPVSDGSTIKYISAEKNPKNGRRGSFKEVKPGIIQIVHKHEDE